MARPSASSFALVERRKQSRKLERPGASRVPGQARATGSDRAWPSRPRRPRPREEAPGAVGREARPQQLEQIRIDVGAPRDRASTRRDGPRSSAPLSRATRSSAVCSSRDGALPGRHRARDRHSLPGHVVVARRQRARQRASAQTAGSSFTRVAAADDDEAAAAIARSAASRASIDVRTRDRLREQRLDGWVAGKLRELLLQSSRSRGARDRGAARRLLKNPASAPPHSGWRAAIHQAVSFSTGSGESSSGTSPSGLNRPPSI